MAVSAGNRESGGGHGARNLLIALVVLALLFVGVCGEDEPEQARNEPTTTEERQPTTTSRPADGVVSGVAKKLAPICVARISEGGTGRSTPQIRGLVEDLVAAYEAGERDAAAKLSLTVARDNLADGCGTDLAPKVTTALGDERAVEAEREREAERTAALRASRASELRAERRRAARVRAARAERREVVRERREAAAVAAQAEDEAAAEEAAQAEEEAQGAPAGDCEPGYDPCVPSYPPDLDCPDLDGPYAVTGADPHGLDGDENGEGCQ